MVSIDFVLARGVSENQPSGIYTEPNPEVPADQRIYAFFLGKYFEGGFDVTFKWVLATGEVLTHTEWCPEASWEWWNAWSWLNPTLPAGQHYIEIGAGPYGGMTIPFRVAGESPAEYQYYDVSGIPSDAEIWEGSDFIGNAPMSFRLPYTSHYLTFKKEGYEEKTIQVGVKPGGETIYINYYLHPIPKPGIRCTLGAEYFVPSGTHPFNIWLLYGIDVDGTYENFASTGPYQWATGGQINIESPGQSIVTNIDLSNITLPSGTYDAITIIIDGVDTSIVHDWKIDNDVLTV